MAGKHPFYDGCESIPNDKVEDIRIIKEWLETQPNIPKLSEVLDLVFAKTRFQSKPNILPLRMSMLKMDETSGKDEHIYMFLNSNDTIEGTKNTITSFFSLRTSSPDIFLHQSPLRPEIQSVFDMLYMVPLPKTTPEGYKVIIFKLSDPDPEKFVHIYTAKAMILFNDIRLSEDGITPGYVVICDARGYSWSHMTKLNLHVLRIYMKYMQEAKPVRLRALHVLYSAKIIDKLVTLVRPFMKAELQKVLKIHPGEDLTNFFTHIPKDIMPEDYGGKMESMAVLHEKNRKLMETKYPKWVEEEEAFIVEATKLRNRGKKNSEVTAEPTEVFKRLTLD